MAILIVILNKQLILDWIKAAHTAKTKMENRALYSITHGKRQEKRDFRTALYTIRSYVYDERLQSGERLEQLCSAIIQIPGRSTNGK